jgi:hypothetical protein
VKVSLELLIITFPVYNIQAQIREAPGLEVILLVLEQLDVKQMGTTFGKREFQAEDEV